MFFSPSPKAFRIDLKNTCSIYIFQHTINFKLNLLTIGTFCE
jgi:hypothetical protein